MSKEAEQEVDIEKEVNGLLSAFILVVLSILLWESEYSTSLIGFSIVDNADNTHKE